MKMLRWLLPVALLIPLNLSANYKLKNYTDYQCMVANLYFEARGEGYEGMKAVAIVTKNRVKSKRYPGSVCGVVFQRKQFSWTHQKSWNTINRIMTGDIRYMKKADIKAYNTSKLVAKQVLSGAAKKANLKDSMYYHANYVSPSWAKKMQRVARVGIHVFYKG